MIIAIIAILAAILFPVFAKAREKARQIACISNLQQIGLAVTQYEQDRAGLPLRQKQRRFPLPRRRHDRHVQFLRLQPEHLRQQRLVNGIVAGAGAFLTTPRHTDGANYLLADNRAKYIRPGQISPGNDAPSQTANQVNDSTEAGTAGYFADGVTQPIATFSLQ